MKTQNLGGIQKHNQREFENHSNKDIDPDREHLNFDLVNPGKINYREKIMSTINEQRDSDRAIRKDAVLVNEWIISSDHNFFKDMDLDRTKEFFETAAEFFSERYGAQNLAYAQVHLDETTPHMHMGVVPMRDGKLQGKNVFNRKELLAIQDELPLFLEKKGFSVERGDPTSEKKHLTVAEYKEMREKMAEMAVQEQEQEIRVKELQTEKRSLEQRLLASKEHLGGGEHGRQKVIGKSRVEKVDGVEKTVYTVSETELLRLDGIRKAANSILAENQMLTQENQLLKRRVSVLEKAQEKMSGIMKTAQNHASRLAEGVFERAVTYAKLFSKNELEVQEQQNQMLENVRESPAGVQDFEVWEKRRQKFKEQQLQQER